MHDSVWWIGIIMEVDELLHQVLPTSPNQIFSDYI